MRLPLPPKSIRVIGFDDAPFARDHRGRVGLAGVICAGTRFEGMVWGDVERDGFDATKTLVDLLRPGKFLDQLHLVLLDGIALAGLNVVDLTELSETLARPCVAVMRKWPDRAAVERVIARLPEPERRLALLRRAGPIHESAPFVYQVRGADPAETARAIRRVTDRGHVPEALRVAHLIGAAFVKGQSSRRA